MNIALAASDGMTFAYVGVYIMMFLFGITIGSFLNVCILRLPRGESLIKSNSHCMTCGAEIKRYDLIPLFSWLILGGKCRACKAPISPRYSVVEALTGILFTLVFLQHDFIYDGFAYSIMLCLFISGVIVIGFEDFDTQEMSVCVLVYLGLIAFATAVLSVLCPTIFRGNTILVTERLIGLFAVSIPLLFIGFVITPLVYIFFISDDHKSIRRLKKRLKNKGLSAKERDRVTASLNEKLKAIKEHGPVFGFGMGDVIFMAAGGLMLGWKAVIVAAFIAIVLGALYAMVLKIISAKKGEEGESAFAFGPFLAIGLAAAVFFGTDIFELYMSTFTVPEIPVM